MRAPAAGAGCRQEGMRHPLRFQRSDPCHCQWRTRSTIFWKNGALFIADPVHALGGRLRSPATALIHMTLLKVFLAQSRRGAGQSASARPAGRLRATTSRRWKPDLRRDCVDCRAVPGLPPMGAAIRRRGCWTRAFSDYRGEIRAVGDDCCRTRSRTCSAAAANARSSSRHKTDPQGTRRRASARGGAVHQPVGIAEVPVGTRPFLRRAGQETSRRFILRLCRQSPVLRQAHEARPRRAGISGFDPRMRLRLR